VDPNKSPAIATEEGSFQRSPDGHFLNSFSASRRTPGAFGLLNFTNPIFLIYNASRAASRRCPQAPSFTRVASADRFSARRQFSRMAGTDKGAAFSSRNSVHLCPLIRTRMRLLAVCT
jgi:hypothetical protein